MKKIVCLLLLIVSVLGSIVYAENENYDNQFDDSVALLTGLGLYNDDSDKKLDIELDRKTLAKYLCGFLKTERSEQSSKFSDVDDSDEYCGYIMRLYELGLLNGYSDGKFRPDRIATKEEIAVIAVKIIGKEKEAEYLGGYSIGYMSVALSNGIFDNVKTDTMIKKGECLKILCNILDSDVGSYDYNNKTITSEQSYIEKKLKIYKVKGLFSANKYAGIQDKEAMNNDRVIIGNIQMLCDSKKYEDLFARFVTAYYREEDGEYILLYACKSNKTSELKINSEDITDFVGNTYTYVKDGKDKRIKLTDGVNVIYNGRRLLNYSKDELMPDVGFVTFVDSDGNNKYDVNDTIIIDAYKSVVVQGTSKEKEIIFDKYDSSRNVYLSDIDEIHVQDSTGYEFGYNELGVGDVISVRSDPEGKFIYIILSDKVLEGSAKSINYDDRTVMIDDVETKMQKDSSYSLSNLRLGDKVKVKFDIFDRVVEISSINDSDSTGVIYIKLGNYEDDKTMEMVYYIKVYTPEGEMKRFVLDDRVTIVSDKMNKQIKAEKIPEQLEGLEQNILLIDRNSEEKIIKITTPANVGDDSDRGLYRLNYPNQSFFYGTEAKNFGSTMYITNSSYLFCVPENSEYFEDEDYYSCNTKKFANGEKCIVEGYSLECDSPVASFVVYKTANVENKVNIEQASGLLISDISIGLDEDDEVVTIIDGFDFYNGKTYGDKVKYIISDDCKFVDEDQNVIDNVTVQDLGKGDIIRYSKKTNGKIGGISIEYDFDKDLVKKNQSKYSGRNFKGYLYSKTLNNNYLSVSIGMNPELLDFSNPDTTQYLKSYWIRRQNIVAKVIKDGSHINVEKATLDDAVTYKACNSSNDCSQVFLLSENDATIYGIIIYDINN